MQIFSSLSESKENSWDNLQARDENSRWFIVFNLEENLL